MGTMDPCQRYPVFLTARQIAIFSCLDQLPASMQDEIARMASRLANDQHPKYFDNVVDIRINQHVP